MTIYEKLATIQANLKAPKDLYNKFGKYPYRSAESILETVKPLLKETGTVINLTDDVLIQGNRYYIKATVTLIDIETGEKFSTTAFAREEDVKKGMDSSQITGAASSYARKYALNGLFAIDDNKDSDATNTQTKDDKGNKESKGKSNKEQKKEYTEEEIRTKAIDIINKYRDFFKSEVNKLLNDDEWTIEEVPTENLKELATFMRNKIKNDKDLQKAIEKRGA